MLTHSFGWRSSLYFTATLGLVGFCAARILLPPTAATRSAGNKEPFDFIGALTFALSVCLILLTLTTAQKGEMFDSVVLGEMLGGLAFLGLFIWFESRSPFPLLDLTLFRIPAFTLGNVARFASFVSISANTLLMPFFLQLALMLDPLRAGFLVAPTPLALALLSPLAGWLSERMAPERLCSLGLAITGFGFLFLSTLSVDSSSFAVILGLSLLGVGIGFFQTPNNNLLMTAVPRERLGVGSAFLSIVRSLGYSVGATLATTIVSVYLLEATGQTSLENLHSGSAIGADALLLGAFLRGYRYTYLAAAVIAFIGAVVSLVPVRKNGQRW